MIRSVKGQPGPEPIVATESPADAQKRLERERREGDKARDLARKAAEKRAKDVEREVDAELAALKKKVAKDGKR